MGIYFAQIIIFSTSFLLLNHRYNYGVKYFCVFCLPFYATPLLDIGFSQLQPVHLAFVMLLLWLFISSEEGIKKQSLIKGIGLLLPFILSLIFNIFYFEPVLVWNINRGPGEGMYSVRDSLTSTNISQLAYIVFGIATYIVYSSIDIDKRKLKAIIDIMLYVVCGVGVFQLIAYFGGFFEVYLFLFNNLGTGMAYQMFLWGLKRVNSVFQEPSYMGYFIFVSLAFYALMFGYREFLRSRVVLFSIVIGVLSTSSSFYLGLFVLALFLYLKMATDEQKMIYYIVLSFLGVLVLNFGVDVIQEYTNAKSGSTSERWEVSWVLPWKGFFESPFFGYGYGTSRPLIIYTQFLFSIGILGTIMFLAVLLSGYSSWKIRWYLLMIALVGLGTFEITRGEIWLFLGLLSNKKLMESGSL